MHFKNSSILARRITQHIKLKLYSTEPHLVTQEYGDKTVLILNRAQSLNALSSTLLTDLFESLRKLENKKSLIVIKGAGDRAFCAGGDILEVKNGFEIEKLDGVKNYIHRINVMLYLIHSYKVPLVVFMDGITMGGGAGLSSFAKYSVATERTVFAMPETKIGFHPNAGGTFFLNKAKGKLGLYLALTGSAVKGFDVYKAGFSTHYCSSSNLPRLEQALLNSSNSEVEEILDTMCEKDGPALSLNPLIDKINSIFSEPTVEGILARLDEDGSDWAEKTAESLRKLSPSSLKVTLRQMQKGRSMEAVDCLVMESNLSINFYRYPDAPEGTRVTLMHKGDVPNWNPSTLGDVTEELVRTYFEPYQEEKLREEIRNLRNCE